MPNIEQQMKAKLKRLLVRTSIVIMSCVAVFLLVVGVVVNFIVTPEKLTPIVLKYAEEYLDADVQLGTVEATFFSSFPRFGVKINDGTIVSHAFHKRDTIAHQMDTLVVFKELRVGVNLMNYLVAGELSIGRVRLVEPHIRLFKNERGECNWDIVKGTDDTEVSADSSESEMPITLRRIAVSEATINYSDRKSKTYAYLADFNLWADGDMNLHSLDVDLKASDNTTYLAVDGVSYLKKMSLGIDGHIEYDSEVQKYVLEHTNLLVDGSNLYLDGWLQPDTSGVMVDMSYGLRSPSVEDIFVQIPQEYISAPIDVEKGEVNLMGTVKGALTKKLFPVVDCKVEIRNVAAKYEGVEQGIENFTAIFDSHIDAQNPDSSYLRIEELQFKGGNTSIDASINVENLLADAGVKGRMQANIDLSSMLEVFPIANTSMSGMVDADLKMDFKLSHLQRSDYGRMRMKGRLNVDSLTVVNDTVGFRLNNDAHFLFSGDDTLKVKIDINRLRLEKESLKLRVMKLHADGLTPMEKDTTIIATLKCNAYVDRFFFRSDTLMFFGKRLASTNVLKPMEDNKRNPYVDLGLKCDTIFSSIYGTRGITELFNSTLILQKESDTTWVTQGFIAVDKVKVGMPKYALPVEASDLRVTQGERAIKIESCDVKAGSTSIRLTGSVHDLYRSIRDKKPIKASLDVEADTLNFNELLSAIIEEEEKVQSAMTTTNDTTVVITAIEEEIATDSMPTRIFEIPSMLDFKVSTKAERIVWSKLELNKVMGNAQMVNGTLHLTDLTFRHGDSRAITIMAYKACPEDNKADINCFVRWEKADIGSVVSSIGIDSVMPMLKPLKGRVDCYFAAKMEMDSSLTVDMHTLKGAMHVSAKRLTLLDTETFAKISKVLMFKNKKENYMDTLSFNVLVDTGYIQILPFVAKMDRYRAVVGGEQDVDMKKLNYHVSILKSPLPFRAGVNILGTPDDIDIDITTAKLRKLADEETQAKYDTMSLSVRAEIVRGTYEMSGLKVPEMFKKSR